FGEQVVETPTLSVPHPRLIERRFALLPLAEIAPAAIHPLTRLSIKELLAQCPDPLPVQKTASVAL
ncbi:MAG: 2-amino-4-hydroxy-6-hydroxymethyldihydropteridine diphosphokinase, partial [Bacteroidota bacterium]